MAIIATLARCHGGLSESDLDTAFPYKPLDTDYQHAPSGAEIAFAFEWLRARIDGSSVGMHYTPIALAKRSLDLACKLSPQSNPKRVLDPSCGAGMFFLALLQDQHLALRPECLWGFDIDKEAVELARLLIQLEAGRLVNGIETRIVCGDALADLGDATFDLIVGNPPWVSFSGRHASEISEIRQEFLREKFECFRHGWPTLHGPFLEASSKALSNEGVLSMVVPQQVAEYEGFAALRGILRQNLEIADLSESVLEGTFEGISTRAMILVAKQSDDGQKDASSFTIASSRQHEGELDKLFRRLQSMPKVPPSAFGDIGIHSGNAAKLLFNSEGHGRAVHVGADITQHGVRPATLFLNEEHPATGEKDDLYYRIGDLDRQQATPVLIRQTAHSIVATENSFHCAFRNSCIAGFGIEGWSTAAFLSWLSSDLIAWYYARSIPESRQRAFPQVKVGALRSLPMGSFASTNGGGLEDVDFLHAYQFSQSELDVLREYLSSESSKR